MPKRSKTVSGKGNRKAGKARTYTSSPETSVVNESTMAYANQKPSTSIAGMTWNAFPLLTNDANKPESHMTPLEKMDIVRAGITKEDLESLKERTALDYEQLAHALSVTRATLINKKKEEKFNTVLSERIVDLADLYSYGYEVFEDIDRFNEWIFRPNKALGGQKPYALLDNQFGRAEVRNIIGRIDYGVYS